jgi:penicillin-binding protein 1A
MDSNKPNLAAAAADKTVNVVFGVVGSIFKVLLTIFLIFITAGLLFTCIFAFYVKTCLTDDLDVSLSDFNLSLSSSILYQDDSGDWQELATLSSNENRVWVDYDNIPKNMEHALVAIEDKRFYEHKGVDWYRTVAAFANMFLTMKDDFGGSTITQQLIKNLTKKEDITVQRKLLEIFRALEFEKKYSKEEIMEWYLNAVYFGEGCYGVYTAAQTYFDKDISELSLAECASIIAITNNPSMYDPFISTENNKARQELVLREMYNQGYIDYDTYVQAVNEKLVFVRSENQEYEQPIYSYYVETVINDVIQDIMERKGVNKEKARDMLYSGGYKIYSCYNPHIQASVDAVYQNLSALPQSYRSTDQQLQSAIVIMDPYTGNIVALAGGVGEKTLNFGLNRIYSQRPPGSSIKPLAVYGPAIEYGLITQNTLVDDSPDITLSGTWWYPRNSGGGYKGIITIRQALISSINTVAAQIVDKLTPAASYDYLVNKLGVTSLVPADADYAPMALGQLTNGITVREMCQAYCSFVNDGVFTYSRTYDHITDSNGNMVMDNPAETHVAWTENTANNITNMLEAAVTSGTGTEAWFPNMAIAGKTGTTSDNWDRWFVGMTPYYVAAVWTGYDTNAPMYFYGNPAAQIWNKVMQPIHEGLDYKAFTWPYVGPDTQIFGDLTDALAEQEAEANGETEESPSPTPTESPTQTTAASPTDITEPDTAPEAEAPVG